MRCDVYQITSHFRLRFSPPKIFKEKKCYERIGAISLIHCDTHTLLDRRATVLQARQTHSHIFYMKALKMTVRRRTTDNEDMTEQLCKWWWLWAIASKATRKCGSFNKLSRRRGPHEHQLCGGQKKETLRVMRRKFNVIRSGFLFYISDRMAEE